MKTQNITTLVALTLFNYFSVVIPAPDARIKADKPKTNSPVMLLDTSGNIDGQIDQPRTVLINLNRPKTFRD